MPYIVFPRLKMDFRFARGNQQSQNMDAGILVTIVIIMIVVFVVGSFFEARSMSYSR